MDLYKNALYLEDLKSTAGSDLPWEKLKGKSILISGATGLVGSFLTDVIMTKNEEGLGCTVYVLTRNTEKAAARFSAWQGSDLLKMVRGDVCASITIEGQPRPRCTGSSATCPRWITCSIWHPIPILCSIPQILSEP